MTMGTAVVTLIVYASGPTTRKCPSDQREPILHLSFFQRLQGLAVAGHRAFRVTVG